VDDAPAAAAVPHAARSGFRQPLGARAAAAPSPAAAASGRSVAGSISSRRLERSRARTSARAASAAATPAAADDDPGLLGTLGLPVMRPRAPAWLQWMLAPVEEGDERE